MELMTVEQAIIKLIKRLAVINYPVTALEIQRWLEVVAGCHRVVSALDDLVERSEIIMVSGFYCLPGRELTVTVRLMCYPESVRKLTLIKYWSVLMLSLPWVKGVLARGSATFFRARPESDLDLVIVATAGRLWSTRWWVNGILTLLRRRPRSGHSRNRVCNALIISRSALDVAPTLASDDWLFCYDRSNLIAIGPVGLADDFTVANQWLVARFPNWTPYRLSAASSITSGVISRLVQSISELISGVIMDDWYRWVQYRIMPAVLARTINQDRYSIVTPNVIALHGVSKNIAINNLMREI